VAILRLNLHGTILEGKSIVSSLENTMQITQTEFKKTYIKQRKHAITKHVDRPQFEIISHIY
jgi:hypothetical protein